jgi:hypothetical protein
MITVQELSRTMSLSLVLVVLLGLLLPLLIGVSGVRGVPERAT